MAASEVERRVAARAAAPFVRYAGVMTVEADLHVVTGHITGALRVEMLPQLLHIQMDHGQHAQHRQGNVSRQPIANLQRSIVLHFDGCHGDADQIDVEHHPLFELLQHDQYGPEVHAQAMTDTEVTDAGHQRYRRANSAERHHRSGQYITLLGHLNHTFQHAGINAHTQQPDIHQRQGKGEGH